MTLTVKEIENLLKQESLEDDFLRMIKSDNRVSVKKALEKWEKNKQKLILEEQRIAKLYDYENEFKQEGIEIVAGVDEAGRGPLVGPVSVAAVILPLGLKLDKINDSKKLTESQRVTIYEQIRKNAIAVESILVEPAKIDEMNILQATIWGMYQVLEKLNPKPQGVLIDAVKLPQLKMPSKSIIKGDALSASIAAASIVAKVERDLYMAELDKEYPVYGFAKHKGYGTAEHIAAIKKYGPCPAHRKSFEPIKSWE